MGFALIFIGVLLVISAVRGTTTQLAKQVQSDFTGQGNFIYWLVIVLIIGAIGYIPPFRLLSRGLLALVILALILTKGNPQLPQGGVFSQFTQELTNATSVVPASVSNASTPNVTTPIIQV